MTGPILLPARPGVQADKPRMIDYGGPLTPVLGGPVQTIMRMGTRHALNVTLPKMRTEPTGRIWSSRLCQAKLFGALMAYSQDGLIIGLPGAPVVDGSGQSGMTLALRGFRVSYAVREGQAFSLIYGGARYLHFAAAPAVADGEGKIELPIYPMLRVIPDDGDTCEFASPKIQGSLSGNETAWDRLAGDYCDFGSITITEDA